MWEAVYDTDNPGCAQVKHCAGGAYILQLVSVVLPSPNLCLRSVAKECPVCYTSIFCFVSVSSEKHLFPDITILWEPVPPLSLLEKQEQWDLGMMVGFHSFLMFPRSNNQAGQMTCHSVTSLELVQLPTAAILLMVRAPRATLQRTTGSSSGMCGIAVLDRESQFMSKKR